MLKIRICNFYERGVDLKDKNISVDYMRDYLRFALEFEKYVYVWTNAMNQANSYMRKITNQKNEIERVRLNSANELKNLNLNFERKRKENESTANRYKKKAYISVIVTIIDILVCIVFGFAFTKIITLDRANDISSSRILLASMAASLMFFIFTIIGPACIMLFFSNRSKYKEVKKTSAVDYYSGSIRRKEAILKSNLENVNKDLNENAIAEQITKDKQNDIFINLQEAKKNLHEIYSNNILPPKYRTFNAVATLYEYLATGRCNIIEGHGGIYDTYEKDLQAGIIISTLSDIRDSMYRMECNQQILIREMQYANQSLSKINTHLANIEKTNEQIEKNTAITAVASQQTAAATKYLAWRQWHNDYY